MNKFFARLKNHPKKALGIFILLFGIIISSGLFFQFIHIKQQEENMCVTEIYKTFPPEENIPISEINLGFLKKHPLLLKINGSRGLYIKSAAYKYYTGNTVDYLEIQKLVTEGQYEQVCTEYKEFMGWINNYPTETLDYLLSLCSIANSHEEFIQWNGGNKLSAYSSAVAYAKAWELYEQEIRDYLK